MRRTIALIACVVLPASARAQMPNMEVRVDPRVETLADGRQRVSYTLHNGRSSQAPLFEFAVESPVTVADATSPDPEHIVTAVRDLSGDIASWGWIAYQLAPGDRATNLSYEAVGLPGFVRYRVLPYTDTPVAGENGIVIADETDAIGPRFEGNGREFRLGRTVGIVAVPGDATPQALKARLGTLLNEACTLGWIDSRGICNSLRVKLGTQKGGLQAMQHELDAQRGKHVNEAAYALLYPNVTYLLSIR
jgi:hypothetical protein